MTGADSMVRGDARPPVGKVWRWPVLTLLCLAAHVALIWTLEEPLPRPPLPVQSETAVRWVTDSWMLERMMSLPGMHDPALFALPALEGFSGSAWLTFKPFQPDFSAPNVAPYWLEMTAEDLGNVFERLFTTNTPASIQISDLPLPSLVGTVPAVARELSLPASIVRADSVLAERLPSALSLPGWASADLLGNSIVQVVVDSQGRCVSSALLAGCGLKEADAFAIKWARECSFKPLRAAHQNKWTAEPLVCGKLIFYWQTLPPTPVSAAPNL